MKNLLNPKVLMLLKCNGLEYDDRVRKECSSLKTVLDLDTEIHVIDELNRNCRGRIYETNTLFKSYFLLTRNLFKGNKLLFLKLIEFFLKILPSTLKKRKAVWLHDPIMFIFVPYFFLLKKLGVIEVIVWDQHELPPSYFLKNKLLLKIYKLSMRLADQRIHANQERAIYLNEQLGEVYDYKILNNYIDDVFLHEKAKKLPETVNEWLNGKSYILLQSGAYNERHFDSAVKAISSFQKMKCIVVGSIRVDLDLYRKTVPNFDELFYFVGMVPQIRLVDFIDKASASLIMYKSNVANSLLCEPNRLYQASCRGTPVIVGNNPPMARFVKDNANGFVLKSDGEEFEDINQALLALTNNDFEGKKVVANWSSQNYVFNNLMR